MTTTTTMNRYYLMYKIAEMHNNTNDLSEYDLDYPETFLSLSDYEKMMIKNAFHYTIVEHLNAYAFLLSEETMLPHHYIEDRPFEAYLDGMLSFDVDNNKVILNDQYIKRHARSILFDAVDFTSFCNKLLQVFDKYPTDCVSAYDKYSFNDLMDYYFIYNPRYFNEFSFRTKFSIIAELIEKDFPNLQFLLENKQRFIRVCNQKFSNYQRFLRKEKELNSYSEMLMECCTI